MFGLFLFDVVSLRLILVMSSILSQPVVRNVVKNRKYVWSMF